MFVEQHEKRVLISRALGVQIPNPGSVSRRAGHDNFDISPPLVLLEIILQRCHFEFSGALQCPPALAIARPP
jgi:hypothetical protein